MVFWLALTTRSQPNTSLGTTGSQANGLDVVRPRGNLQMAPHGTALLGQTGHIQPAKGLAVQMRSHANDCTDGDHTGAAHASDHDSVWLVQRRKGWLGKCREG